MSGREVFNSGGAEFTHNRMNRSPAEVQLQERHGDGLHGDGFKKSDTRRYFEDEKNHEHFKLAKTAFDDAFRRYIRHKLRLQENDGYEICAHCMLCAC